MSEYNNGNQNDPFDPNISYYDDGWKPRKEKKPGRGWMFATVVLAAFIAGAALMRYLPLGQAAVPPQPTGTVAGTPGSTATVSDLQTLGPQATLPDIGGAKLALGNSADIPAIVQADSPTVVGVLNIVNARSAFGLPSQGSMTQGSGSGVIISADGYIVTNNHVVEGADSLSVVLSGGEEVAAKLVGADAQTDLAVIKIDRKGLTAIPIGDSDAVRVGEMVLAIGNPLGQDLAGTVTMGIISAENRQIQNGGYTYNLLQTDAAVNPGNSGGALVDMKGELIGINQLKITTSEVDQYGNPVSAEGLSFAIPINDALPIVRDLIRNGYIPRPTLGIDASQEISQRAAQRNHIPVGIYLEQLTPNGPAAKAGVRDGDILTKADGHDTPTLADMNAVLSSHKIGDTIKIEIWRDGNTMTFSVKLGGLKQ